jgi:DNA-binding transcriptional MerR regulator
MMFYTTAEIAEALGVNPLTVQRWVKSGLLHPQNLTKGTSCGQKYRYSPEHVLAIAISRELKARWFGDELCIEVAELLLSYSLDELEQEWERGRRYLLIVGDATPIPRLLTRAEIIENPKLPLANAEQAGISVMMIDVEAAYRQLLDKLNAVRKGAEPCKV